jgi:hypothetical protein
MDVRRVERISALAILVLWLALPGLGAEVHVLSDQPLSGIATRALDVRWLDENAVLVTVYEVGVVQVDTRNISNLRTIVQPKTPPCRYCGSMALSSDYLATALEISGIAWKPRRQPQSYTADLPVGAVRDFDVYKNRVAILGSWLEDRHWAGDGAIGWVGTLGTKLEDLRPILFPSTAGGASYNCKFNSYGGVRFFSDGSLVFVSAIDPGVYLYGPDLKLAYAWQTDKLGFLDRCDLSHEQSGTYGFNPEARTRWLAQNVTVDEVLPMPEGPALILRGVADRTVHWTLLQLRKGKDPFRVELPFTAPSDAADLRGDVQGNRLVFIVRTLDEWRRRSGTTIPTRLILARWE